MPSSLVGGRGRSTARLPLVVLATMIVAACGGNDDNQPAPPGPSGGQAITGRERIGWDQPASSAAELETLRFAIYVDGTRSEIADASCASAATSSGFACSGRLPTMTPGSHTLEIAAFVVDAEELIESDRSAPLRVTVAAVTTAASETLQPGDVIATGDGVRMTLERVEETPIATNDIGIASDGRVFRADSGGSIRVLTNRGSIEILRLHESAGMGGVMSLALSPDFERTGHVFVAHGTASPSAVSAFRVSRYRLFVDRLVDRMVLLPDIAASSNPAASLRFGPDGKLYAAFDDADDRERGARLSDWSGKLLRIEANGRTPDDQASASPVIWSGLRSPGGLDWSANGDVLWMSERGADDVERLRAIVLSAERPRRASERSVYVLPRPLGAVSLTVHRGGNVPEFAGNLFVAAREGGYILRVRLDVDDPGRAISSERLLDGMALGVRAIHAAADGAIYFATDDALWRLSSTHAPDPGSRSTRLP